METVQSLIALGEKCRPVCIGVTWRRLFAAGIVREWKPKLEEVFREADQFGVAVAGGVERVAMEAQLVHQTGHWIVQTDCSNACNAAKRTAIMAQAAKSTPGLVGYITRCYDEIPAEAIYKMGSGERRAIECKSGVQQGDGMGPPLFCFTLSFRLCPSIGSNMSPSGCVSRLIWTTSTFISKKLHETPCRCCRTSSTSSKQWASSSTRGEVRRYPRLGTKLHQERGHSFMMWTYR